jgi:hypothetical protein
MLLSVERCLENEKKKHVTEKNVGAIVCDDLGSAKDIAATTSVEVYRNPPTIGEDEDEKSSAFASQRVSIDPDLSKKMVFLMNHYGRQRQELESVSDADMEQAYPSLSLLYKSARELAARAAAQPDGGISVGSKRPRDEDGDGTTPSGSGSSGPSRGGP